MFDADDAVIISPPGTHIGSVIWLHGLGADGYDFEPIVPELRLPAGHGVKFIFPHAPRRPVTINGGMVMRAWYDVQDVNLRRHEDEPGIKNSAARVQQYIENEIGAGIPSERIVLAGFSQGGAIALYCALRLGRRLAGVLALSAYLPLPHRLQSEAATENRNTRIMMAHGSEDPIIPVIQGKDSREQLEAAGYTVTWTEYAMPHAVCPEEIRDIAIWLKSKLPMAPAMPGGQTCNRG